MNLIKRLFRKLNVRVWLRERETAKRRERYEFLKERIKERHFGGYGGLIVNFPGRRFDVKDMSCFPSPMYYIVKNQDGFYCIFWDRGRMTREVGTGEPLKEGEIMAPDHGGRTKPDGTLETIDEQKPLPAPIRIVPSAEEVAAAEQTVLAAMESSRGTGDSSL